MYACTMRRFRNGRQYTFRTTVSGCTGCIKIIYRYLTAQNKNSTVLRLKEVTNISFFAERKCLKVIYQGSQHQISHDLDVYVYIFRKACDRYRYYAECSVKIPNGIKIGSFIQFLLIYHRVLRITTYYSFGL